MGAYVNPPSGSKENFLRQNGKEIPKKTLLWDEVPAGSLPVVLLDNGMFTAAAIAYSPQELAEFTRPDDRRPRKIFILKIEDLLPVSNLREYLG